MLVLRLRFGLTTGRVGTGRLGVEAGVEREREGESESESESEHGTAWHGCWED